MNHLDVINGTFEAVGALSAWFNIRKIRRDKSVAGVYWPMTAVWSLWGAWNVYFYSALECWFSALAGFVLALGNTIWVGLAVYYLRRNNRRSVERDVPVDSSSRS